MRKDLIRDCFQYLKRYSIRDYWRYFGKLYVFIFERALTNSKWFNPFATLYLNLRCVPLKQAFKLPIFVYGRPRLYSTLGHIRFPDGCKMGMVHFNESVTDGPQCEVGNSELNLWGTLIFRGKCTIGTSNKICVGYHGVLDMGAQTKITILCNVTAYKKVTVGHHSWIVHRCQVFDTSYHYTADFRHGEGRVKDIARPVFIGDYCWICNTSTITAGVTIPNKTIVASNSLVSKDMSAIPEESLIGGIPAKLILTGMRRVEKNEREIWQFFKDNPDQDAFIFSLERKNEFV